MTGALYNPQPRQRKAILCLIFSLTGLLLLTGPLCGKISPLAKAPDWQQLDPWQKTVTRDQFARLLHAYAPNGAAADYILIDGDHALIRKKTGEPGYYTLFFAPDSASARKPPAYWQPLPSGNLFGAKIALDPGHLGGQWAKMEERWFQIGDSIPVMEGELTLLVAQKVAAQLSDLGANVTFVRDKTEPLTTLRPSGLRSVAEASLKEKSTVNIHPDYAGPSDPAKESSVQWEAELLFYRIGEIRARAERNNSVLQPDLTICLHFNAGVWGDPAHPTLVPENHLHLIINGNYDRSEIAYDDIRFDLLRKLLSQSLDTELAISEKMAASLHEATGLPPYEYTSPNARKTGTSGYVWLRNLLANRLYQNPVLYLEPYVMNNQQVFDRIQAGDYDGTRVIDGLTCKSIFNEYADAVVQGLLAYVSR